MTTIDLSRAACPKCGSTRWSRLVDESSTSRQTFTIESATDYWGTEKILGTDVNDIESWICIDGHEAPDDVDEYLSDIATVIDFVP